MHDDMAQRTASATPSTLSLPSDREIQIDRSFNASQPLVWRAWTEPKLLPKWMGPAIFKMTKSEMDLRKGGKYRWEWDVPPAGLVIRGNFLEVDAPRRMVTEEFMDPFPDPSRNTITFTEKEGRTTVSVLMKLKSNEARDAVLATGMKKGMDEGYGRLDGLLKELR